MLELKELAQFFTDELNNIGNNQDPRHEFLVHAELGEQKPRITCGVLRVEEPTISPVDKILNINYKGSVEFSVRTPESNINLINVEKIIGILVEKFNGKNVEFSKGNGVLNLSYSRAKDYKIEAGVGQMTPLSFSFTINYSENVVTEAIKHWFIKEIGEDKEFLEIPFLTERVSVEKDGKVNPINDRKYKQAFMMAQQRTYAFTMPYDTSSGVASMLTKDILNGDANKNYILKYYDGVAFTEEEPFLTQVVLYRNGDNGGTAPNTSILNLFFTDADDGKNSTKYFMALIDNPFDGTTENTRWFDNQTEQIDWFKERINDGADFDSIDAPNLNSLVLTNQIYKNSLEYDVFDLVNKNYAIIRVEKAVGDEVQKKYYYYKVANANIGANNQVIYDLRLDSLQTWLFRDGIVIEDSFISKAHLDRWIYNDDGTVTFNGKADSKLFEREEIRDVAKRLVSRQKLKYYTENEKDKEIVDVLNQYDCWCYIYLSQGTYKAVGVSNNTIDVTLNKTKMGYNGESKAGFDTASVVLCFPVYFKERNSPSLAIKNEMDKNPDYLTFVNFEGFDAFVNGWKLGDKTSEMNSADFYSKKLQSIKLSIKPPFDIQNIQKYNNPKKDEVRLVKFEAVDPTSDILQIKYTGVDTTKGFSVIRTRPKTGLDVIDTRTFSGLILLTTDYTTPVLFKTSDTNIPKLNFTKSEIVGSSKNKDFNPKINSEDYKSLAVTIAGDKYEYPINKLNTESPVFEYFETLTADTTKGLLRFLSKDDSCVFNKSYSNSFNGLIYTNDFTIDFAEGAYSNYIANNKNAYLSFQNQQTLYSETQRINRDTSLAKGIISTLSGTGTGALGAGGAKDPASAIASVGISAAANIGNMAIDYNSTSAITSMNLEYNQAQFDLSIDNMKNAPDTLVRANGSAYFAYIVSEFGIYAEIYEGLDTELESANDIMFRDGFTLNRFAETGKSVKDYCHTRKFFNYIKATLGNISGVAMSDTMRADLKQRFSNGVRFWHQDTIDYSMENYELELEKGEQNV